MITFLRETWDTSGVGGSGSVKGIASHLKLLHQRRADLRISDELPTLRMGTPRGAYSPARRALWFNRAALGKWFRGEAKDANEILVFYDQREFGRRLAKLLDSVDVWRPAEALAQRSTFPTRAVLLHGVLDGIFWFGARTIEEIVSIVGTHPDVFPGDALAFVQTVSGDLIRRLNSRQRVFILQQRVTRNDADTVWDTANTTREVALVPERKEHVTAVATVVSPSDAPWVPPLTFDGRPDDADREYWGARFQALPESAAQAMTLRAAMYELSLDVEWTSALWELLDYRKDVFTASIAHLRREGWLDVGGIADSIILRSVIGFATRGRPESFIDRLIDRVLADHKILPAAERIQILQHSLVWAPLQLSGAHDEASRRRDDQERTRRISVVRAILDSFSTDERDGMHLRQLVDLGDLRRAVFYIRKWPDESRTYWAGEILDAASMTGDIEAFLDALAAAKDPAIDANAEYLLAITTAKASRRLPALLQQYLNEHPDRAHWIARAIAATQSLKIDELTTAKLTELSEVVAQTLRNCGTDTIAR
ncbi:MAG TPA: hypothetical protein VF215_12385 [Thermoanaerobaculia bacterium]